MATTTYGDISPRTAGWVVRDLLKSAEGKMMVEKFGKPIPLEPEHYSWLDEIPDPLYICTGDCHQHWGGQCPLKDIHSEDEVMGDCCANYEGDVIDGMVGEHIETNRKTMTFRRYNKFSADGTETGRLYHDGQTIIETTKDGLTVTPIPAES